MILLHSFKSAEKSRLNGRSSVRVSRQKKTTVYYFFLPCVLGWEQLTFLPLLCPMKRAFIGNSYLSDAQASMHSPTQNELRVHLIDKSAFLLFLDTLPIFIFRRRRLLMKNVCLQPDAKKGNQDINCSLKRFSSSSFLVFPSNLGTLR